MLTKKMLRDMGSHKTQFISIFLMAFLGVFIYTGIGAEWMGIKESSSDYYAKTNLADAWLYGNGFSDKDEQSVLAINGVTGTERELTMDGTGALSGDPKVTLHFVEKGQISATDTVTGESFSKDKDGIWIDDRFAKARGLKTGDSLKVTCDGLAIEKKILGTVYDPEYVYYSGNGEMMPDFAANGYAYISAKYFPVAQGITYNEMLLTSYMKDPSKLEQQVKTALGDNYSVFMTRDNNGSYSMFQQEIEQDKSMGLMFPVAFLAIALLTLLTSMTRIVAAQRTQIGTLKALGFSRRKILFHYVSYGFWIPLAGTVLGAILGPPTLPWLFYPALSEAYTLPVWKPATDVSFYIMAAGTVALCTLIAYIVCRRVLKDMPAEALRPKAPKAIKHGFFEKAPSWEKLGFNAQWNLRDVFRSKARSIMAMIGVMGCTALLICAFGLNDDLSDLKDWQYNVIDRFQTSMSIDPEATGEQIQAAIDKTKGQAVMKAAIEIKAGGIKKSGTATMTDHVTLLNNTDENRRSITLPDNGVSLSYKMAEMLGVKKGDEITWHLFGDEKWVTTSVAAIYRDPAEQGITLTRGSLEKLGYQFAPTEIITPGKVTEKLPGIESIQQKDDILTSWNDLTQGMSMMIVVLIAAAAVLAIVVLYNLGILSFTEKERELATLKVVGFKSKKLLGLLLTQNIWLSVIGFIPGIFAGKALTDVIMSGTGDSFDMVTAVHPANILVSFAITIALSAIVNLMFSKKIRRLDMVGALKGVE